MQLFVQNICNLDVFYQQLSAQMNKSNVLETLYKTWRAAAFTAVTDGD